jgi:hypothetical protein
MKPESNTRGEKNKQGSDRGITRLTGQNSQQNDAVDHDENNDQNRANKFKVSKQNK